MQRTNEEVAAAFERESKLLAIARANPFRVRAYRNAADTIRRLGRPLQEMVAAGQDLSKLPTIGKDLAHQIEEILATGSSRQLRTTERRVAPSLIGLLDIPGLGPSRVNTLNRELGIRNPGELEQALREGRVADLPGFGHALERRLLAEITALSNDGRRMLLSEAEEEAFPFVKFLRACPAVSRVEVCGSLRRGKPTIGDLDIVVVAAAPNRAMDEIRRYPRIESIVVEGDTRSTYRLRAGTQVDLRAVRAREAGSAMLYFTGNKAHNIKLRRRAQRLGYKLNEYGLFDGEKYLAGKTEKSVYAALGMQYIPPELRHGTDETRRAAQQGIPALIKVADIAGDFHLELPHSRADHERLLNALRRSKYGFVGLVQPWFCYGHDAQRQERQILKRFATFEERMRGLRKPRVYKGLRVSLPENGEIDIAAELLAEIDYLIASVEDHLELSQARQTKRIVTALSHPKMRILAHPLCRDLTRFAGLSVDLERVFGAALEHRCWLEVNGNPRRLDLPAVHCRRAMDSGVLLCAGTEAKDAAESRERLRYAVTVARRGWLTKRGLINCWTAAEIANEIAP